MDNEGTRDGVSSERRVEFRVRKNGEKDTVIIERSAAEGLPEGWIKELVITMKAQKLRKDPFFIDPKSGYIFPSLKDASRYVSTGVIGKYARKPKKNSHDEDDSANGKIFFLSGSTGQSSPEDSEVEKMINIYVRNSKRKNISSLDEHSENCKRSSNSNTTSSRVAQEEVREKEQIQDPIGRELIPCSENDTTTPNKQHAERRVTRSQAKVKKNDDSNELGRKSPSSLNAKSKDCNARSKLKCVSLRTLEEGSGKEEKAQDSTERKAISCSEKDITNTPVKRPVERRVTRSQTKLLNNDNCELKGKTKLSDGLPRRASKRLAGIELEPTLELKTRTRAWQVPQVGQSDDARAGECKELLLGGTPDLDSCKIAVTKRNEKHFSPKQNATYRKSIGEPLVSERTNRAVDKKPEGHSGEKLNVLVGSKNKKMGSPQMSTRGCQAAIAKFEQTGLGEGASKSVALADIYKPVREKPQGSMVSFQAVATKRAGAATCRRSGRLSQSKLIGIPEAWNACEHPSEVDSNLASVVPTGNFAVVKGSSCSTLSEKNAYSVSEPLALDSTLADLWKDPCIAFAIRTLTGESLDPFNAAGFLTEPKKSNAVNNQDEQRGLTCYPVMPESSSISNQRPGHSTELPVTGIWKDPCIDLSINNQTGAVPIGFDELEGQSKSQLTTTVALTRVPKERKSHHGRSHLRYNTRHKAVLGGPSCPQ